MREQIFYFDGDGIKSQAGWYYRGQFDIPVGPFHTQYSAEEALIDLELQTEEEKERP